MFQINNLQQISKAKIYNNDFSLFTEYDPELDCKYCWFSALDVSSTTNYNNIFSDFHHRWLEMNNFVYSEIISEPSPDDVTAVFKFDYRKNQDILTEAKTIWAIKILLPPHTIQLELLAADNTIIATIPFFEKDGDMIEYANSYQFWSIFKINMTLPEGKDSALEEYLHKINSNAHIWDVYSMPPELMDKGSMANKDYILAKYSKTNYNVSTNINNNLLTNSYRLYYLGERIPYCTDMQTVAPDWTTS